jgi:hypothetical protein
LQAWLALAGGPSRSWPRPRGTLPLAGYQHPWRRPVSPGCRQLTSEGEDDVPDGNGVASGGGSGGGDGGEEDEDEHMRDCGSSR